MKKTQLLNAATACGEWMLANQVQDRLDANRGRFLYVYDADNGFFRRTHNWNTGCAAMALLALYRRTGEDRYLHAAELAARYIVSLQVMDARDTLYYGAFREITPQSIEFAPRDATSAAWALVWVYRETKNPLYLDRAVQFGRWHMEHAMHEGWPLYACYMDESMDNYYAQGAFQSGTGLFYHDLFLASGDARFIARGFRPIAERYRDHFFHEDGSVIGERDAFTKQVTRSDSDTKAHSHNDDFGAAMLQMAADFFGDETFREKALLFARWLAGDQDDDGAFRSSREPAGTPVALMYYHDLGTHYDDETLLAAREPALARLLATQFKDTGDPRLDGAFQGRYENENDPGTEPYGRRCVNMRTNAYAVMALLKLESAQSGVWLGRHNKPFIDPLRMGPHNLIW
jgi:hypothetical protein